MSTLKLDELAAEAAVYGGAVLGGGGGGSIAEGLKYSKLATSVGEPVLVSLDELDDDAYVATISGVGAPAATDQHCVPMDEVRASKLLIDRAPFAISGFIANENGPSSGINGWISSAVLGHPVVDAPANGRAHPTGLMGAMGIHRLNDFLSIQTASGGNPETGRHIELVLEGKVQCNANIVRHASIEAGGVVKVARDPVKVSYLKEHAAPGATSQAISIGQSMLSAMKLDGDAVLEAVVEATGGNVAMTGQVKSVELQTTGGYDLGSVTFHGNDCVELSFWNEFMTFERNGCRLATFPDLIAVLSLETGIPITTAELRPDMNLAVLIVPRDKLILGRGVLVPETIKEAEVALCKSLQ